MSAGPNLSPALASRWKLKPEGSSDAALARRMMTSGLHLVVYPDRDEPGTFEARCIGASSLTAPERHKTLEEACQAAEQLAGNVLLDDLGFLTESMPESAAAGLAGFAIGQILSRLKVLPAAWLKQFMQGIAEETGRRTPDATPNANLAPSAPVVLSDRDFGLVVRALRNFAYTREHLPDPEHRDGVRCAELAEQLGHALQSRPQMAVGALKQKARDLVAEWIEQSAGLREVAERLSTDKNAPAEVWGQTHSRADAFRWLASQLAWVFDLSLDPSVCGHAGADPDGFCHTCGHGASVDEETEAL